MITSCRKFTDTDKWLYLLKHMSTLDKVPTFEFSEKNMLKNSCNEYGKFDALVNGISVGLPTEVIARRQQYEYYRGKLLTFDKVNN